MQIFSFLSQTQLLKIKSKVVALIGPHPVMSMEPIYHWLEANKKKIVLTISIGIGDKSLQGSEGLSELRVAEIVARPINCSILVVGVATWRLRANVTKENIRKVDLDSGPKVN